jgi:hypothetical protein
MTISPNTYRGFRFPPVVIEHGHSYSKRAVGVGEIRDAIDGIRP